MFCPGLVVVVDQNVVALCSYVLSGRNEDAMKATNSCSTNWTFFVGKQTKKTIFFVTCG